MLAGMDSATNFSRPLELPASGAYDILYKMSYTRNRSVRSTGLEPDAMNILTFSDARAGLKQAMDAVCRDHVPTVITRVGGDHVVLLSLEDFNSMQETMYLLGSARNASRLMESVAQLRAGGAKPRAAGHGKSKDPK